MRTEADFNVTDKIKVYAQGNDKIAEIINNNLNEICGVVLADAFVADSMSGVSKEWNINGEKVTLGVEVV